MGPEIKKISSNGLKQKWKNLFLTETQKIEKRFSIFFPMRFLIYSERPFEWDQSHLSSCIRSKDISKSMLWVHTKIFKKGHRILGRKKSIFLKMRSAKDFMRLVFHFRHPRTISGRRETWSDRKNDLAVSRMNSVHIYRQYLLDGKNSL